MSPETCEQIYKRQEFTKVEIGQLNAEFAELDPKERIERTYELFGDCLVLPTTFGPTAPLLLRLASVANPDIQVVNIRHGHDTERTQELAEWYIAEFDLNVRFYDAPHIPIPEKNTLEFLDFQDKVKIEPFQNMIDELRPQACLFGVMSWQTNERKQMSFVEERGSILAINPILDVVEQEVADFFEQTGLPYNDDYFDPTKANSHSECRLNTSTFR